VAETTRTSAIRQWFTDTRSELRKVVWPTRDEAINLTIVVLLVTMAMSVILGGVDYFFTKVLEFLLQLVRGG